MTDGTKGLLLLLMLISVIVMIIMWTIRNPSLTEWWVAVISTVIAVACLVGLFIPLPKDLVPDYLFQMPGSQVSEKNDLCFSFSSSVSDHVCFIHVYFQNQRCRSLERWAGRCYLAQNVIPAQAGMTECRKNLCINDRAGIQLSCDCLCFIPGFPPERE